MKRISTISIAVLLLIGVTSCKGSYYVHHSVRMVDAKSYMDHPVSASLFYYH